MENGFVLYSYISSWVANPSIIWFHQLTHFYDRLCQILGDELQALQKQKEDQSKGSSEDADHDVSDVKGKAVVDAGPDSGPSI